LTCIWGVLGSNLDVNPGYHFNEAKFAYFSTLKLEVVRFSETSVNLYRATLRPIPHDARSHCCKDLTVGKLQSF
jgi:hypothetical protein